MTDLMGYWSVICPIFRVMISLENLSGGSRSSFICTVFLEHRLVWQSEARGPTVPRRGGVSAAQAEATSVGFNIVDNTITHTNGTYTFSILRCGFNMDDFFLSICIYYVLTYRVQLCVELLTPSCLWFGVSRVRVQTTESADGRNIMPRPPTAASPGPLGGKWQAEYS
jgi:hypothetical protein